jgi:archaeal type IV pilus assembly protein PilA
MRTNARARGRKAISPVIATVILIAITLIAAIAIAGFVFGIFGSFSSSATVTVTSAAIPAAGASNTGLTAAACATSATAPYVAVSNSGTGSTTVTGISLTYAGTTYRVSIATCTIGAAGSSTATQYVDMTVSTGTALKGIQYVGSISLGNGASVSYTGVFQ